MEGVERGRGGREEGGREGREEGREGEKGEGEKNFHRLHCITQIEEHLMFTETKLDEKNRENERLGFDLEEARRSKQTP